MNAAKKPLTRACWLAAVVGLVLAMAALDRLAPLAPRSAQGEAANPADDRQSMLAELRGINEKVKIIIANAEEVRGPAPTGVRADGEKAPASAPAGQPGAIGSGEDPKVIIIRPKADHAGN
jgi:hypothetical protein